MSSDPQGEITQLLERWHAGDEAAFDALVPLVYRDLRALARSMMQRERPDHTLQPTALLNETYLRLARQQKVVWTDRAHFFAFAARLMRNILTDHARTRLAARRGGQSQVRLELKEDLAWIGSSDVEILDLYRALERLEQKDARKARIVELRYFFAMTTTEAAEALNLSVATAERDLQFARAWLFRELRGAKPPHEP